MLRKIITAVLISAALVFLIISMSSNSGESRIKVKIGENVFQSEVADDDAERTMGLSGRDSLTKDEAMLFIFERVGEYGFWMKDMKFPLDFIWIKGNEVVGTTENISPEKNQPLQIYYPPVAIDKVLEVNAGEVEKKGIKKGEKIEIL